MLQYTSTTVHLTPHITSTHTTVYTRTQVLAVELLVMQSGLAAAAEPAQPVPFSGLTKPLYHQTCTTREGA